MDRRGFLKGILIAPVAVGVVGATKQPVKPSPVIKVEAKAAHSMQSFSVEVDSQKKRNLYGKTAVLADRVGFDTISVEIHIDPHETLSTSYFGNEVDGDIHTEEEYAYLQVKIKEPGSKGNILIDELGFRMPQARYYLPVWVPEGSKISVRVKDNRRGIRGYTVRLLITGGME